LKYYDTNILLKYSDFLIKYLKYYDTNIFLYKIHYKKFILKLLEHKKHFIWFMVYNRIEINKIFLSKEILSDVKEYIYSRPNGNYALFADLHFHKKQNFSINDLLKEKKYRNLSVLYNINNEDDYNNFIDKNKIL
jgi:hypothetical protein